MLSPLGSFLAILLSIVRSKIHFRSKFHSSGLNTISKLNGWTFRIKTTIQPETLQAVAYLAWSSESWSIPLSSGHNSQLSSSLTATVNKNDWQLIPITDSLAS